MNFEMMLENISENYLGYFWLIMAVFFLFAEIGTPGLFFFVAFAIGSCIAAPFAFLGYSFAIQCIIALAFSLIAFAVLRKYFASKVKTGKEHKTNMDALDGQIGNVIKEICLDEPGQVKVGGEIWSAQSLGGESIGKGCFVKVVKVVGNRLIVERVSLKK